MSLLLLDALAETRIETAIAQGMLDRLPGAGRPLILEDDRLVPEELRAAYRMLRNAGFGPPEVEARREVCRLVAFLATLDDDASRRRALTKLAWLEAQSGNECVAAKSRWRVLRCAPIGHVGGLDGGGCNGAW
jgi:hypothetical protein